VGVIKQNAQTLEKLLLNSQTFKIRKRYSSTVF